MCVATIHTYLGKILMLLVEGVKDKSKQQDAVTLCLQKHYVFLDQMLLATQDCICWF